MSKSKRKKSIPGSIAVHRRASFDYDLGERFEAGLVLQGWEVKSIRDSKGNIAHAYVLLKQGEAWLIGSQITPLLSASTHVKTDPERSRKLLLHRSQLDNLVGCCERKGFTLVPTRLYWKKGTVKLEIALAKGKKNHDKRAAVKEREWQRTEGRALRSGTRTLRPPEE